MGFKGWENTEEFLIKYGNSVEKEIKKRLSNHGKIATGNLYDSIGYEYGENKAEFYIEFFMDDYGRFVDRGVNGFAKRQGSEYSFKPKNGKGTGKKSKFITALMKWCKVKGLPETDAFRIRRGIWKFGIAPTQFWTIPTTRRDKEFNKGLEKAMAKDIDKQIEDEYNN